MTTVPLALVGFNVAALVADTVSPAAHHWLMTHATLYPGRRFERRPYTLLTHAIHHLNPMHCLVNCVGLYSFGQAAGYSLRPARVLALYAGAAVAGGCAHLAHGERSAALGASGGVLGLATFVQLLNPYGQTLVFFVLPIPNWATVLGMAGLSVYFLKRPAQDTSGFAHAGHLGGMATGAAAALAARRGLLRW